MSLISRIKTAFVGLLGITLLAAVPAHAAGTLPLAMAQQIDVNGQPLAGCLVYFFAAGTVATPQNSFSDFGLTLNPKPILACDQAGRVPMFWLADGLVHVRLTDSSGLQVIDTTMQVLGPSSGGGGGGATVDPTSIMATGDIKARYGTGPLSGFVRANGLTIGNATCGCSERANADTQALFTYLYGVDPNLAVSGGRTGNALNDYNASKQLTLPDWSGRALAGLDDMGAGARGRLTPTYFGTNATALGAAGGLESSTLTSSNQLPTIVSTNPSQSITLFFGQNIPATSSGIVQNAETNTGAFSVPAAAGGWNSINNVQSNAAISTTFTNASPQGFKSASPMMLATIYMKL